MDMIKAIIFDMNGVIINDEWAHAEAWRRLGPKFGKIITDSDLANVIMGRPERGTFEYLLNRSVGEVELTRLSHERVELAKEILDNKFRLPAGLDSWFKEIDDRRLKTALATGSRRPYTKFILEVLGLENRFESILTSEDYTHGKPHPEVYLRTAQQLVVDASACVVIEDTPSGIAAGKAAGMHVIGLASTYPQEILKEADVVIGSFESDPKITIADLESVM